MNKYSSATASVNTTANLSSPLPSSPLPTGKDTAISQFPKARAPKQRLWTVSKTPAPLPLGLYGRHILTDEELSLVE